MRKVLAVAALAAWLWPVGARAVMTEDFVVKTAEDIVDLCATPESEPLYEEAVSFCHGYLVGAVQLYFASVSGPGAKPVVCLPEPRPPRAQAVAELLVWLRAHPEYLNEKPPDALMKFLVEKWPCPS